MDMIKVLKEFSASIDTLEVAILNAKEAATTPELHERLDTYLEIVDKQRVLVYEVGHAARMGLVDEVTQKVARIDAFSRFIRDDANAMKAVLAEEPEAQDEGMLIQ